MPLRGCPLVSTPVAETTRKLGDNHPLTTHLRINDEGELAVGDVVMNVCLEDLRSAQVLLKRLHTSVAFAT